ncbi:MAG: phycobilisome rod-core linker polypeptide [Cyanobacteriota bacterium]|jgi:phycobilisome rod-core linker protein|nr:phycobilisome rod-core linker polypeptide [Cyanobacteriota bacterium]
MALPLLNTAPVSMNARVSNFMPATEESPRQGNGDSNAINAQIEQAYRQIFFHAFKADRDLVLESQLRSGRITVREFVRGLLLSDKFRNDFYRCNSNYRVVEQLVGRVLGRPVHGERERIAWSIVIAEKGLPGLVDALLDSPEYMANFGIDQVPYQRSRTLAGKAMGELPFNQQAPRYDAYWRDISAKRAPAGGLYSGAQFSGEASSPAWAGGQPPQWAQKVWIAVAAIGAVEVVRLLVTTAGAMLSTAR